MKHKEVMSNIPNMKLVYPIPTPNQSPALNQSVTPKQIQPPPEQQKEVKSSAAGRVAGGVIFGVVVIVAAIYLVK